MVPNAVDPQAWNRYSYVLNRPLVLLDPTGHRADEGCGNGKLCDLAKTSDSDSTEGHGRTGRGRQEQSDCLPGRLVDCFYDQGVMPEGDYNITSEEYRDLLEAIKNDVNSQYPRVVFQRRGWYDTPFYNLGGEVQGSICVDGANCHDRTEYNYVAQGMWSAAIGETEAEMKKVITDWKNQYGHSPSEGTILMAEQGYDFYLGTWSP